MSVDSDRDERLRRLFVAKREGDTAYLIESLQDPDTGALSARWLSEAGEQPAIPGLVKLLDSPDAGKRIASLRAFIRLGPPRELKMRLREIAEDDPHANARSWACAALGEYHDRTLVPFLISVLSDSDWRVRAGAAAGLGEIGDPEALEPIRKALRSLRRSPIQWYMTRTAYETAIRAIRDAETQA